MVHIIKPMVDQRAASKQVTGDNRARMGKPRAIKVFSTGPNLGLRPGSEFDHDEHSVRLEVERAVSQVGSRLDQTRQGLFC